MPSIRKARTLSQVQLAVEPLGVMPAKVGRVNGGSEVRRSGSVGEHHGR